MLDTDAITRMIEKQITTTVNDQVVAVFVSAEDIVHQLSRL
jgi:hypothetical protein